MKMPRSSPWIVGLDDVDAVDHVGRDDVGHASVELHPRMVAHEQPRRDRRLTRAHDLDLPTDERVGEPRHADDAAVLEEDRVLDFGVDDLAVRRPR